ncbi:MAG: ImmA/IrrE family metallo-endopeptidase [Hyphomicrobium sp.]|nr:ImmA/IrrE family metallo-endopeptidase [Hyphomicrobium sp.]
MAEVINRSSDGATLRIEDRSFNSIDGALVGSGQKWVATVSTSILSEGRRAFTLAHEIGHFCCHRFIRSQFDCTADMIDDFVGAGLEKEANLFAARILLPPNKVRPYVDGGRFNFDSVRGVSSDFGVSLAAAGITSVDLSSRKCAFFLSRDGFIMWGKASDAAYRMGVFFRSSEELPAFLDATTDVWTGVWKPRTEFGSEIEFKASRHLSDRTGVQITCLDFGM